MDATRDFDLGEKEEEKDETIAQETDSHSERSSTSTTAFTPGKASFKSLEQIKELFEQLRQKQIEVNKDLALKCKKHNAQKLQDEKKMSEKSRCDIITEFIEENSNRFRMQRERHETRLNKVRQEQIAVEKIIFGEILND